MACTESENLTALVDGELSPADRARVEAHLASCATCPGELALLQSLSPKLSALPSIEPSAQLRRNVLNALPEPERGGIFAWLRGLAPLGGVAVTAGVLVALGHFGGSAAPPEQLALAENLDVVENLGALETADLSDEDLEVVAHLDQLEAKE